VSTSKNKYILKYKNKKPYCIIGPFNNNETLQKNLITMISRENTFLNFSNKNDNELYNIAIEGAKYKIVHISAQNKKELELGLEKINNNQDNDLKLEDYITYEITDNKQNNFKTSNKYYFHILIAEKERMISNLRASKCFLETKTYEDAINELFFEANERCKHLLPKLENSSFVVNMAASQMGEISIIEKNDNENVIREVLFIFPESEICNSSIKFIK
jgi:hypothetical protein